MYSSWSKIVEFLPHGGVLLSPILVYILQLQHNFSFENAVLTQLKKQLQNRLEYVGRTGQIDGEATHLQIFSSYCNSVNLAAINKLLSQVKQTISRVCFIVKVNTSNQYEYIN